MPTWRLLQPAHRPPARFGHGIAYDEARGEVVVYGGYAGDGGGGLTDTWVFDGADWIERQPASSPSLSGVAMVYDGARGVVLAIADLSSVAKSATFTWDGKTWTERDSPEEPPPRFRAALAYDPNAQGVLMFGGAASLTDELGDTWLWADAWQPLSPAVAPPARQGHQMTYDAASGHVLLHGGCGLAVDPSLVCDQQFKDTWAFRNGEWSLLDDGSGLHDTVPLMSFAFAYDPGRMMAVRFGGHDYYLNQVKSDRLFEWDGSEWEFLSGLSRPSPRGFMDMVYDPALEGLVLFGGLSRTGDVDETWSYGCSSR